MIAAFIFALVAAAAPAFPTVSPSAVLARYSDQLAAVVEPKAVIFNYTIVQQGQTALFQTHRIYRDGSLTRDETTEIDGHLLSVPTVRISNGRTSRYRISDLAPSVANYSFKYEKSILTGHHWSYVYKTEPAAERAFTVNTVTIDGASYLPSRIEFTSTAGTVKATGTLTYAKADHYWLIQEANVAAPITGERSAERIVWTNYAFPGTLPAQTFKAG